MVKGSIFGVLETKPENIIKIVETNTNIIHPLNKPPKGDCYRYMVNLALSLKDASTKKAATNENVIVYLTSGDEESHVFDNWNLIPRFNDKKAWKTIS